MTFPYKIEVDKCVGSCNDLNNPYFKVCLSDVVKNVRVKRFDLISKKNILRNISFHQSCECGCLLDKKVCNNKQTWKKDKCRCECLEIKECDIGFSWNVVNCSREMKKYAALIEDEEYDVETDDMIKYKTVTLIKKKENCKPFVASSILFVCVSVITTERMIHFCLKSINLF